MPRTKDQTLEALDRFMGSFYGAAISGVQASLDEYPTTAHIHRKTTRRNLARDHIVYELRGMFDGDPSVRIRDENQTTYFGLLREYQMLVKKADEVGAVELSKTQTSFLFQSNDGQLVLDEELFPEVTNLYLSYVPNEDDPRNPQVLLICPRDGGYHWIHEIEPPAAVIAGEIGTSVPPDNLPEVGDDLVRIPVKDETDESE